MAEIGGWSFPVEPEADTGRIRMVEGGEAVRQGIRILLETEQGERRMLPSFGAGLSRFMFETVDLDLVQGLSQQIVETVRRWERHVTAVTAEVSRAEPGVQVAVDYRTDLAPGRERLETRLELQGPESGGRWPDGPAGI